MAYKIIIKKLIDIKKATSSFEWIKISMQKKKFIILNTKKWGRKKNAQFSQQVFTSACPKILF